MSMVKTHPRAQIILSRRTSDKLGIRPGTAVSIKPVDDHVENTALPIDPIEFPTGIFKDLSVLMAEESVKQRQRKDKIDDTNSL